MATSFHFECCPIEGIWNLKGSHSPRNLRNESMNNNKHKKETSNKILVGVRAEMAKPRMSKSAKIAELNSDTARIAEQPRIVVPGTVDKLIPSSRPSQPEKAQIAIEGDHGYRDLRIENSLTDEHGDEVKLKKNSHVEVAVTAEDAVGADPKAVAPKTRDEKPESSDSALPPNKQINKYADEIYGDTEILSRRK